MAVVIIQVHENLITGLQAKHREQTRRADRAELQLAVATKEVVALRAELARSKDDHSVVATHADQVIKERDRLAATVDGYKRDMVAAKRKAVVAESETVRLQAAVDALIERNKRMQRDRQ